jgi:hypothetical protein
MTFFNPRIVLMGLKYTTIEWLQSHYRFDFFGRALAFTLLGGVGVVGPCSSPAAIRAERLQGIMN